MASLVNSTKHLKQLYSNKKKKYTDAKILNKILANQAPKHLLKELYTTTK